MNWENGGPGGCRLRIASTVSEIEKHMFAVCSM